MNPAPEQRDRPSSEPSTEPSRAASPAVDLSCEGGSGSSPDPEQKIIESAVSLHAHPLATPWRAGLGAWLRSGKGSNLLEIELESIHLALANLFGYHCLQIGDLAGADLMHASRIISRCLVDIDGGAQRDSSYPVVSGSAMSLPIEADAVDVVILPHVLEFEPRPPVALREVARVLVPEGHLLLLAFNPISPMGVQRLFRARSRKAPWCGTYLGSGQLRDWLGLLGFDILDQRPCFAARLSAQENAEPGSRTASEWFLPALASARLIVARKRVGAMLPMRPRWKSLRSLVEVRLGGTSPAGRKGS
ncbi:MAG: class I SAM-dependent methyltransferase [Ectothiorhodospiraceae bacterium AqS1]|nr:class I SAM-dependent methyltransferase [Ectothiorhodospiraceae bacterium AqS1]